MVKIDVHTALGGIAPLFMLSCMLAFIGKHFKTYFTHYKSISSPLLYCYIFMMLSCCAILVDAAVITSGNLFVYASQSSACCTFTAYAIVIYVWVTITQKVSFVQSRWITFTGYLFWMIMALNWIGTMLLEYFLEAGNILITVSGPVVIVGYVLSLFSMRRILTAQQIKNISKITALSNIACAIFTLCTGFIMTVIFILEYVSDTKLTIQLLHFPLDIGGIIAMTVLTIFLGKFASNKTRWQTNAPNEDTMSKPTSVTSLSEVNSAMSVDGAELR